MHNSSEDCVSAAKRICKEFDINKLKGVDYEMGESCLRQGNYSALLSIIRYYAHRYDSTLFCAHPLLATGEAISWYKGPKVRCFYMLRNGILHGECSDRYSSGYLARRRHYVDGVLHGPYMVYDEDGSCISQREFYRGVQDGEDAQLYPLERQKILLRKVFEFVRTKASGTDSDERRVTDALDSSCFESLDDALNILRHYLYTTGSLDEPGLHPVFLSGFAYSYHWGRKYRVFALKEGKLHGEMITYWGDGEVCSKVFWRDGVAVAVGLAEEVAPGDSSPDSPTDTSHKDTKGKVPLHCIPPEVEEALAWALHYGLGKYGDRRWKPERPFNDDDLMYAAVRRHLNRVRQGHRLDDESGLPHLWHALCSLAIWVTEDYMKTRGDSE